MLNIFSEIREIRAELARLRIDLAKVRLTAIELSLDTENVIHQSEVEIFERIDDSRTALTEQLTRIEAALTPPTAARIVFMEPVGGELKEITDMQMKVDETKKIVAKPVDKFGNEAEIEQGSASWALTDPAAGVLTPAADGKSADFVPAGKIGSPFSIQFSADADLGEGVKAIVGDLPVDLLPGEAVAVELSAQ